MDPTPAQTAAAKPVPLNHRRRRGLPASAALGWLSAGWRDFLDRPAPSLAYGLAVFAVSVAVVWTLFALGLDYILFPALAGFMVVGPLVAIGLYQKSRDLAENRAPSLSRMIFVRAASGSQVLFTGAILCLLMLLWMRAAVIIYALFFGLRPFPGLDHVADRLARGLVRHQRRIVGRDARVERREPHLHVVEHVGHERIVSPVFDQLAEVLGRLDLHRREPAADPKPARHAVTTLVPREHPRDRAQVCKRERTGATSRTRPDATVLEDVDGRRVTKVVDEAGVVQQCLVGLSRVGSKGAQRLVELG